MPPLLAGTGRSDITPAPGTPQGGWGAQTHQRGIGADLPFYATALALSDGELTLAIVDVDSIGFDTEWTNRILDATVQLNGLPRERLRLSCSHTHSGPNTFRLATISEGRDMALSYLESLPHRIAGAVWQALQNLRPARVAAGEGRCEVNVNRRFVTPEGERAVGRNWEGVTDPTVRVVRFDALDETPVATLVHYACHPTTIAWQNRSFTPDYPGPLRQTVEQNLGGTCLFLQGPAANLTPRRGFTGDLRVYRALGRAIGLEAACVAQGLETLPRREKYVGVQQSGAPIALYEDEPVEPEAPVLRMITRDISLPLRVFDPPEPLEAEAARLRAELERLRASGTEAEIRQATARATQAGWAASAARANHGKTEIPWQMQGIRIGDTALLSVQGEPFVEIGLRIAEASPFAHTLFSGYANGAFGYIATREAWHEGGYEVRGGSPFSAEAADVVVEEGLRLLRELAA